MLRASPGQVVYGRDMIHDKQHETDWLALHKLKCAQVLQDNKRENKVRVSHQYEPEQQVLITRDLRNLPKLAQPTTGPFRIIAVRENGTVLIDKGLYVETINIRRLRPYSSNMGANDASSNAFKTNAS
jgi:hypothetical protein